MPSSSGILMSVSTISGCRLRNTSSACKPFSAVITSYPLSANARPSTLRIPSSSSASSSVWVMRLRGEG